MGPDLLDVSSRTGGPHFAAVAGVKRVGSRAGETARPKRLAILVARTSRILNARSLDELVGETADAARRVLRVARAVAFVQTDEVRLCCGRSPRWPVGDTAEPTRAVPLVARDGHRLGALQVWTREGSRLTREDDEVLQQIAHCAATIADGSIGRAEPRHNGGLITRLARVVHDLRTPLTAILSWTWALRQGLDGARATRALEALERNARTQARLLDEAAEQLRAALASEGNASASGSVARPSLDAEPRPNGSGQETAMEHQLRDVMTTGVETVAPGDTIRYAAEKMEALDIGSLPVCDGERLVGVLTDRDIAIRAVASGRDPNRTTVIETMTPRLVFAYEEQPIAEAVELMREHEIRRLPIVDRGRRLVGIVALADLAIRSDEPAAMSALEGVSKPRVD
jgi:CBS domain-containing protein